MKQQPPLTQSNGSILITSLLLLLVMTILAVTALNSTVMEEKMSSNTRQKNLAHQAAETALKAAEAWLDNTANVGIHDDVVQKFTGVAERYNSATSASSLNWDTNTSSAWTISNSQAVTTLTTFPNDANLIPGAPRYLIEYVGRVGEPPLNFTDPDLRQYAFRVVAIGWGPDKNTKVVLSSSFRKRLL
ncbi:MAG: hypothetical protein GXP08_05400 [Gammaproteobacteria bacterium]|nr:hypothetical protein [Gammaproteobacteria bacterium]